MEGIDGQTMGSFVEIRNVTEEQALMEQMLSLIHKDSLTGLYNRRYLHVALISYDQQDYFPVCMVSADINKLKLTNDTYGHAAGDRLIRQCAMILRRAFRVTDVICRIGGDEFAVIAPNTNEEHIKQLIDEVGKEAQKIQGEPYGIPSIALGYAVKYEGECSLEQVLNLADKRMYENKARSRSAQEPKVR